jgi:hypothetical protein
MKLFLTIAILMTGLGFAQDAKVAPNVHAAKTLPTVADKDRAEFLLVQRDWLTLQRRYEEAFKKEPVAAKYESASQALAKTCADGGAQFNAETVQCVAAPTKEK